MRPLGDAALGTGPAVGLTTGLPTRLAGHLAVHSLYQPGRVNYAVGVPEAPYLGGDGTVPTGFLPVLGPENGRDVVPLIPVWSLEAVQPNVVRAEKPNHLPRQHLRRSKLIPPFLGQETCQRCRKIIIPTDGLPSAPSHHGFSGARWKSHVLNSFLSSLASGT